MADGPNQLEILIKLISDLTGGKLAGDQIDQIKQQAQKLGMEGAAGAEQLTGALQGIIPALGAVLSVGGQIGMLVHLEKEAALAAAEWQQKILGIGAVLANTNQFTAEQVKLAQELADAYEKRTTVSAQKWLDVESVLLRIGKVRMEDMGKEMKAVENLAGLTGKDLAEAGYLYSKALEGNFTMLERLLPDLREYKDTGEKLLALQHDLTRGEGELEEQGKGAAGATRQLANAQDELFRTIGKAATGDWKRQIADMMHEVSSVLGGPAIEIASEHVKHLDTALNQAGASGEGMGKQIAEGVKSADEAVKTLLDDLDKQQDRQDKLTDAQMAADISRAKLAGEKAKLALPGDDKIGREHIDLQVVTATDQIRERYKEKKLADEREILQAKLHTLEEETRKSTDVIQTADQNRVGKEGTYTQVYTELVRSLSRLNALGVNIPVTAALGDLDALYGKLQAIDKAALPGTEAKEIAGYSQYQVKALANAKKSATEAGAGEDAAQGEQGAVIAALQQQLQDIRAKLQVNKIESGTISNDANADIFKRESDQKVRDTTAQEKQTAEQKKVYDALDKALAENLSLHQAHAENFKSHGKALEGIRTELGYLDSRMRSGSR